MSDADVMNFSLEIVCHGGGFTEDGSVHLAFFESQDLAFDERDKLTKAWSGYRQGRPNDWSARMYTLLHDLGEIVFDLEQLRSINLLKNRQYLTAAKLMNEETKPQDITQ